MVAALILTGAPGAGKSSTLGELGTRLEIAGIRYGSIESEQLAMGSPVLPGKEWLPQLAAVLQLQREAGRRLFLIAATLETEAELRATLDAAKADKTIVVCLRADPETLAKRLDAREPDSWPGKQALIDHARELAGGASELDGIDLVIDTDRHDRDQVVEQILKAMSDHWGLSTQPYFYPPVDPAPPR